MRLAMPLAGARIRRLAVTAQGATPALLLSSRAAAGTQHLSAQNPAPPARDHASQGQAGCGVTGVMAKEKCVKFTSTTRQIVRPLARW
jgi:hypothetical protein